VAAAILNMDIFPRRRECFALMVTLRMAGVADRK
jgi:hypothetical protein